MTLRKVVFASLIGLAVFAMADPASASVTPVVRSAYGAGYRSAPAAGISSARTRFVVPSVTCPNNTEFMALHLGVFGYDGIGASTSFAELFINCNKSFTPSYLLAASTPNGGSNPMVVTIG